MNRYYLNAMGIASALGIGKGEVRKHLFAGWQDGLVKVSDPLRQHAAYVGLVNDNLPEISDPFQKYVCRNNRLALAAVKQIELEVRASIERYGAHRVAIVLASSTSGIAEGELALTKFYSQGEWPKTFSYQQQEVGTLAEFLSAYLGTTAPSYTIATACSSSGKAFASAQRLLDANICDAVVVGGADTFCRLTLNGFTALESVSSDRCNPFSRNRDGINIGEGAALFLMTRELAPVALLGVGESSDAYHISAPDPEGYGAIQAMQLALKAANLQSKDIAYLNLHGTATPMNDIMEGRAVASIFGTDLPCSSTKAVTGHTLGAAGAIEAAFLWLCLQPENDLGLLPPHIWDGQADPEIPPLNLVQQGATVVRRTALAMLSNSFAFGGSNVSVVLGAEG